MRRSREEILRELEDTKRRLDMYLKREETMLAGKGGVQKYSLGTRSVERYDTDLSDILDMIKWLRKRIHELELELAGQSARKAVGVVPRDW